MSVVLISGSNSISDAILDILNNRYITYNIDIRDKPLNILVKNIKNIKDKYGNIFALINTDSYNILSPLEELNIKDIRQIFEINLFNNIKLMKFVLKIMRQQNSGRVINIVSVAGRVGFPMVSAYSSAQFALEGINESLRYEVERYNIKITLVEIGAVKNYLAIIAKKSSNEYYSDLMNKMKEGLKILMEHGTDPKDVAKLIKKILESQEPDFRYSIGNDASMLLEAKKNLNEQEFEKFMREEILPED